MMGGYEAEEKIVLLTPDEKAEMEEQRETIITVRY